jgi:two-component system, NarL family, sensor histidine kinase DevS
LPDRKDLLLDAGLALASELSLPIVLQRIVDLAAEVTDARYGALGVLGPHGTIKEFITTGLSPRERQKIGPVPKGHGILGVLITDARPLRLPRIADDPRSVGFPPNHPPMGSFLGAPVKAMGSVFGNIYLTEKRGGGEFSQEDEEVLVLLATQAGVAIANATLYEQTRHRERWLEAQHEITDAILAGNPTEHVVTLICRKARELVEADLATVVTQSGRSGVLILTAADGSYPPGMLGMEVPSDNSLSGEVMRTGKPIILEDASHDPRGYQPMVAVGNMGHTAFLPLSVQDRTFGTLAVAHKVGGRPFTEEEIRLARTFADQASVALEYGRTRQDAERLAIMEDRERIAKELHDGIIQSLFAVGMSLQGTAAMSADDKSAERIETAVGEIDRVIRDLRNYIFGLRPGILADRQLDTAIRHLVEDAASRADLGIQIEIDADVASELASRAPDVIQLVREALSNIVRHADASRVELRLTREAGSAVLTISDDGRGYDPGTVRPGQGLGNMTARVEAMGGSSQTASAPGQGTRLRISLPL